MVSYKYKRQGEDWELTEGILDKKKILSYNAKKRAFVATVAVVIGIAAIVLGMYVNDAIAWISLPVIIAAAFVVDKVLIIVRPDIYGKDMLKRGRTPVIATTTVVAVFTAICLLSGIVGCQLAIYTAENANVVATYDDIGEAVDFLQTSGLESKYNVTVTIDTKFGATAVFSPKSGEYDIEDFKDYKHVEESGNSVKADISRYAVEYNGEEISYYVLNEKHLKAKIEIAEDGMINVVDYGQAFGIVLGATFGAVVQIAVLAIVYVVGIIAAIVPSEIYFEKLIRNEAKKAENGNSLQE